LLRLKQPACLHSRLLHYAGRSTFKQLILSRPLSFTFIRNMSVPNNQDLKGYKCERGKVTQRPPISYLQYRYKKWLTEPDKITIKLLGGDTFQCKLMGDASNAETYMKWYFNYLRIIVEKKSDVKLLACSETLKRAIEDLKKPSKVPKREPEDQKAERELELATCKVKSEDAYAKHATVIGVHYDLFRQLLSNEPQVQWDRIVGDLHNKNPWTGLNGDKHPGLCMKTAKSLEDCIMFHKITVVSVDAAERQKAYMMGSLKKPRQLTAQNHISRCEVLNGYIGHLPTLCDSPLAVASTKKGNKPFNKATLASIVLSTCPTDWRNQYEMNHKTVPESTRSMLLDLENIEKVFVTKDGKKARSIKASAGTAPKKAGIVPKKHGKGGGSGGPAPKKKARSTKYCNWCKAVGGAHQTHDTIECCRFDKDGKEVDKPSKPFDSAKKPWKKGGGDSGQMAYLTEKFEKLEKKLKKSKKAAKKHAHDLSDSDSDSD
jgi:hypothetical protein